MTDSEKLQKIIEKAVKNGLEHIQYCNCCGENSSDCQCSPCFMFNHQFAKAYFGEYPTCLFCGIDWEKGCECVGMGENQIKGSAWQWHLQQLVLLPEDQRIDYLAQYL